MAAGLPKSAQGGVRAPPPPGQPRVFEGDYKGETNNSVNNFHIWQRMACYRPIHGFRKKDGKGFTINPAQGSAAFPMSVPCGYCIGCRLERSRQWAVRCVHEAQMHENNCFITLTFSPEALKARGTQSLRKRDFQLFMKRLRRRFGKGIRYMHCGEYGEKLGRPHYHACIFGFDFPDKVPWRGNLFRSVELERLWPWGYSSIGRVTFESAAYVARYVVKKRYGKDAGRFYVKVDADTGLTEQVDPEYATMSRRPAIGRTWIEKYYRDVYPKGYFTVSGRPSKPPRYYDQRFELMDPATYRRIKARRKRKGVQNQLDKGRPSLHSQEVCAEASLKEKKRTYEKGE